MNEKFRAPQSVSPQQLKEVETKDIPESQYKRILRNLRTVTENLKSTREYLSDKLYLVTGSLDRGTRGEEPKIKEVFVPLVGELDEIYNDLYDINEDINFILNNVEL
jgi:hypothetical protein